MWKVTFDPKKVGELEAGWWRAHNEKNKAKMGDLIIREHQEMYGLDAEESTMALTKLVAAVKYHDVRDWERAEAAAAEYYEIIKIKTAQKYDSQKMGKLEVGWWKVHDELEFVYDKTPLAEVFAELYATQYGLDKETMMEAGRLKAQATYEHDLAEAEGVSEVEAEIHWQKTGELAVKFYEELKERVG